MGTVDLVVVDYVTGVQHLGIPIRDMGGMLKFYGDLGFGETFSTWNNGKRVMFIRQESLAIELYKEDETAAKSGTIDHIVLGVTNMERTFELAGVPGYEMPDTEVRFLPFWEYGVKFFIIMEPNGEKVESSQKMQ